jgi:Mg-chelatase subunit ChlI
VKFVYNHASTKQRLAREVKQLLHSAEVVLSGVPLHPPPNDKDKAGPDVEIS